MRRSIASKHIKEPKPLTMAYSIRLPIKDVKVLKSNNINLSTLVREMVANEAASFRRK